MRLGATRGRLGLLGLLLAAWGLVIVLDPSPTAGNKRAPRSHVQATASRGAQAGAQTRAARSGARVPQELPRFRQDLLDVPLPEALEPAADLFGRPLVPAAPAAATPRPVPTPQPVMVPRPVAPPAPLPTPAPVAPPPPPPVVVAAPSPPPPPPTPDPFFEEWRQYRLLGTAEGAGGAAAFVMRGPDLLVVRQADQVGTRYLVKEIQDESVVLVSPDGEREVILSMPPAGTSPTAGSRQSGAPPVTPPRRPGLPALPPPPTPRR